MHSKRFSREEDCALQKSTTVKQSRISRDEREKESVLIYFIENRKILGITWKKNHIVQKVGANAKEKWNVWWTIDPLLVRMTNVRIDDTPLSLVPHRGPCIQHCEELSLVRRGQIYSGTKLQILTVFSRCTTWTRGNRHTRTITGHCVQYISHGS